MNIPEELFDEITTAVNTRNTLAHGYLLTYRIRKAQNPKAEKEIHGETLAELRTVRGNFQALNARLHSFTRDLQKSSGLDVDKELEEFMNEWQPPPEDEPGGSIKVRQ